MDVKKDFLGILQDYVEFPVEEIVTSEPFKAVSGIDSFVMMEIVNNLEEHFGITVPNNVPQVTTILVHIRATSVTTVS